MRTWQRVLSGFHPPMAAAAPKKARSPPPATASTAPGKSPTRVSPPRARISSTRRPPADSPIRRSSRFTAAASPPQSCKSCQTTAP